MPSYQKIKGAGTYTVDITAAAATHTKGSYTEVTSATTSASSRGYYTNSSMNSGGRHALLDWATGAAASEVIYAANLMYQVDTDGQCGTWYIPIEVDIAVSTRIAARVQNSTASVITRVFGHIENRAIGPSLGSTATYGADTSTSRGTSHDPGSGASKASYTQITSSTSALHRAFTIMQGRTSPGDGTATYVQWSSDVAKGAAASEVIFIPDIKTNMFTNDDGICPRQVTFPYTVVASTRIAFRAQATDTSTGTGISNATDRTLSVVILGQDSKDTAPRSYEMAAGIGATVLTSGSPAHSKGSYAALVSASSGDSPRVHIGVRSCVFTARFALIDMATGAAASEVVFASNMHGHFGSDQCKGYVTAIDFDIAASTRIAGRSQSSTASEEVAVWALLEIRNLQSNPAPQTYGAVTASSRGTAIDPGAVADTKSAYVELSSASTGTSTAMSVLVGLKSASQTLAAATVNSYDIAGGAAGSEVIHINDGAVVGNLSADWLAGPGFRLDVSIAASTRIAARSQCNVTTANEREINLMVVASRLASGTSGGGASPTVAVASFG